MHMEVALRHRSQSLPDGTTRRVRTAWIVLEGERGARFVTAFPDRKRRQR